MVSSLTFLACTKIQHFHWNALKFLRFMSIACGLPLLILRVAIRVIHWFNGTFGHYGPLGMPKGVWPSLSQCGLFFVQTTIPTPSMHQNLPNTESVLCKTTISSPKLLQNYRITLITFVHFLYKMWHWSRLTVVWWNRRSCGRGHSRCGSWGSSVPYRYNKDSPSGLFLLKPISVI